MWQTLRSVCGNLEVLSIDPSHIAFKHEAAHWRKKTPGIRFLRKVLVKFNAVVENMDGDSFGPVFTGRFSGTVSFRERQARDHVYHGTLPLPRARSIHATLTSSTPFLTVRSGLTVSLLWCVFIQKR